MRSKIAQRILDETPLELKQKVKDYANEIVNGERFATGGIYKPFLPTMNDKFKFESIWRKIERLGKEKEWRTEMYERNKKELEDIKYYRFANAVGDNELAWITYRVAMLEGLIEEYKRDYL